MDGRGPSGRPRPTSGPRTPIWHTAMRPLKIALAVASALVLALTSTAWSLYRDLTAGITTTDVIDGGSDGDGQDILLVGMDSRTDAQGNPLPPEVLRELHSGADTGVLNSDTIMLLHVPAGGGAAIAFSIPRDAFVDIPGYRRDKINAAYPATKARVAQQLVADGVRDPAHVEAEAAREGRSALVATVEDLTGAEIDHYAEINLLGFYNLTTAIGGVEVCLTGPVDDELSGAHLPAGPQTISGGEALAFVRQRHGLPHGDLSRIRRQQVFLAAVADKILSSGTLTEPGRLGALVEVAQQSLVIDAGWDVLAFAREAADIAAGNLEFLTIPTRGTQTNTRGDVVLVDRFEVRDFVERQEVAAQEAVTQEDVTQEDAAAQEDAAQRVDRRETRAAGPLPPDVVASRYVVDVRNGSAATGLAAGVAARVSGLGFLRGTVDNTAATSMSVVQYAGPDVEAARALADVLGDLEVERRDEVSQGHLLVVLGADFGPVPTSPLAPPAPDAHAAAPAPGGTPGGEPVTATGVPCVD